MIQPSVVVSFLCMSGCEPSTLHIRNPALQDRSVDDGKRKSRVAVPRRGMRSARLTDNRIVLPRRTEAYTANEGSFTKLGPRLYSPSNSLGPASRPSILAKSLCGLNPRTSENHPSPHLSE